jgi:hypothetical protein
MGSYSPCTELNQPILFGTGYSYDETNRVGSAKVLEKHIAKNEALRAVHFHSA